MMPRQWTPLLLAGLAAVGGCDNAPSEPDVPVLTILAHYAQTGENVLLHSDGSAVGSLGAATMNMVPIGTYDADRTIALLAGNAVVLTTLSHPEIVDTVIDPAPVRLSLVAFAPGGRFLALISVNPDSALLLYDRASRRLDTLSMGGADPARTWPPVFSPDGQRIALITVTELSMQVTLLQPDQPNQPSTSTFRISRILNRPLFGWPRWTDEGILMAFRRAADQGPDTLLVATVQPDDVDAPLDEHYRAVLAPVNDQRPEIAFGISSTYALSEDGNALVLAAFSSESATTHSLYVIRPGMPRIQVVEDEPGVQLFFPQFINN